MKVLLLIVFSVLFACQRNNQVAVTNHNAQDNSSNNRSKAEFRGKNNKINVKNTNTKDLSQNKEQVIIVEGNNNNIKIENTNVTDLSKNNKDTIVIKGDNQNITIKNENGTAYSENSTDKTAYYSEVFMLDSIVYTDPWRIDAASNYHIGKFFYDQGQGVSNDGQRNHNLAYTFIYHSAIQGNTEACRLLGEIYYYGFLDKEVDDEQAAYWYRRGNYKDPNTAGKIVSAATLKKIDQEYKYYNWLNTPMTSLPDQQKLDLARYLFSSMEKNYSQRLIFQQKYLEKTCVIEDQLLRYFATKGNVEAQYMLGKTLYMWGGCVGKSVEDKEYELWLKKAQVAGNQQAGALMDEIEDIGHINGED